MPPTYLKYMTGKFQKRNEVQNPSILEVLRKRSTDCVTDGELSQVTLFSVAQPKMLPATHATKRVIIPRSANLQNASICIFSFYMMYIVFLLLLFIVFRYPRCNAHLIIFEC